MRLRQRRTLLVERADGSTEWLRVPACADDLEDEATALLEDPRDTITTVYVWHDRRAQFAACVYRAATGARGVREANDDHLSAATR